MNSSSSREKKVPPAEVDVPLEAHRLELRQQQNPADLLFRAIGQGEVDDAIARRTGPPASPAPASTAPAVPAATRQDHRIVLSITLPLPHQGHQSAEL